MYQYPYGNAQQLNLDWLMEQWQEVKQSIDGSLQGEIDRVEAAITDLLNARDAAVTAASAANTSAGAAASSANTAAGQAAIATAQAAAATQERINAANAANNAQTYAGNAQTQATAAANSAGAAYTSANQAAASASDAHDDALAAAGSASDAHNDALAAAQDADDAANSASDAHDDAVAAQAILDSIPEDYSELSDDVSELKTSFIQMPDSYLTKKILGNGSFNYSRYSRKVERIGNHFITTHLSGSVSDATRYNTNLFGETVRTVTGTTLTPNSDEFIEIKRIGRYSQVVLYRDENVGASSGDGIRVVLADTNDNILYNDAVTQPTVGALVVINILSLLQTYSTATKIALYYYSADATTHETYLGIYPRT